MRGVVCTEGGCQQFPSCCHDLIPLPTAPSAHKNTITNRIFHPFDQPDHLISLITWCTRLTLSNHLHRNVCSELLHLHGYVYSHALMFDKEEAYKNQPQGRRWYHGRSDGCKDAPMHESRGPVRARLTPFSSGRDKWQPRGWRKVKTPSPWSASAATSPAVSQPVNFKCIVLLFSLLFLSLILNLIFQIKDKGGMQKFQKNLCLFLIVKSLF